MKWDPFREFDRMFDDDWGLVPMVRSAWNGMPIDVSESDQDVTVEIGLPAGIDPAKADVSVEGDVLTVRAASETTEEQKQKNYFRREIRRGSFERSVRLPAVVKGDQAEAVFEKGVLRVTIPKADEAKPKKIQVRVK